MVLCVTLHSHAIHSCGCAMLQVLKSGNPQQVLDSLHTLLQSIMTLYKIARYYGTPQRMTTLFSKITNQMIRLCKDSILAPGKLWDQDKATLISNMQVCGGLHTGQCLLQRSSYHMQGDCHAREVTTTADCPQRSAPPQLRLTPVTGARLRRSCVCACATRTSSSTSA